MARTDASSETCSSSSTSTLTKSASGCAAASSAKKGLIFWHGPHHSAVKSTIKGMHEDTNFAAAQSSGVCRPATLPVWERSPSAMEAKSTAPAAVPALVALLGAGAGLAFHPMRSHTVACIHSLKACQ